MVKNEANGRKNICPSMHAPNEMSSLVNKKKNDVICIIGMHRSGTSMVARLLNLCGLDLGPSEQFLKPNEYNPLGYFENEILSYKINDALLAHLGASWDNPPLVAEGWEHDPSLEPIVHEAKSVLKTFSKHSHWGWKDPRTTVLLPFWKSLIPNLRFVICVRNPLEVAASLGTRDRIPIQKGVYLWNQYMQAAIRNTQGCPRLFTFYEDYFQDASREIDRLVEFCELQKLDDMSVLHNSISTKLRHHSSETIDLLNKDKLLTEYKLFYVGLRALTSDTLVGAASDGRRENLISDHVSKFVTLLEQFHDKSAIAK